LGRGEAGGADGGKKAREGADEQRDRSQAEEQVK